MRSARLLAACVIAIAALALTAQQAAACSCVFSKPKDDLARADAAFNGRLLKVTDTNATEAVFRYRVGQVFKGRKRLHRGDIVEIHSVLEGSTCALPRTTKKVYGLLVQRHMGEWSASLCSIRSPRELRRAARKAAEASGSSQTPCA
jgi:hypothetical protein